MHRRAPLLVIGLDGATFDLVGPWVAGGRLPNLGGLMQRGAWCRLRSTVPAATFPAWTSLVTGVNPGRHGVLDFFRRVPGAWRLELVNRTHRRVPALWSRLGAAARRVAVLTVPGTYPPEPVNGIMVSGWDSPLASGIDGSFVFPRDFYATIRRRVGRLPFADFQEIKTGPEWHATALARLLDGIERRAALTGLVLEHGPWDAVMVVFGESDTVAHHFWRFHDPRSPRFAPSEFADAIGQVYEALDAVVGRLVAAIPGAVVAVVSDHGSGGASDRVVYLNRRLAECGLLALQSAYRGQMTALARGAALRAIPHRVQGALVRRVPRAAGRLEGAHRFGGVDWADTLAYSEELDYHPSVWINLRGREPQGTVPPEDYDAVRARVAAALTGWCDERGRPVVARVLRREQVYRGPCIDEAPDLLLEMADVDGYRPSCVRSVGAGPSLERLDARDHGGGRASGLNGAHRPDGMLLLAGPGVRPLGETAAADITDVLPTLLALSDVPVPEALDGRPLTALLERPAVFAPDALAGDCTPAQPLDAVATAEVTARLAALGYVERI